MPFLEERPERAVERPGSGLQQQVCAALCPLHLLMFGEALADHSVHRGFGQAWRGSDSAVLGSHRRAETAGLRGLDFSSHVYRVEEATGFLWRHSDA
jgi:hypothetical protein